MTKHRNKGKPGYRGRWPIMPRPPEPVMAAEAVVTVKASATEVAALSPSQRVAFMAGVASIIS